MLTTRSYAAILLTPLAASLLFLAVHPASPDCEAVDAPELPPPSAVVTTLAPAASPTPAPACDDEPALPVAAAPTPATTDGPVAAAPTPAPADEPGAAVLLHGRHLVLATLPDRNWTAGPAKFHALADGFTVDYALARDVVPAAVQAQQGARYTLFASDGASCQVDAGPLAIHGRMDGVFLFNDSPPTRAELREVAASMQPDAHVVQADLRGARSCTGVWARRADLPAPIVFARKQLDAGTRAQVRASLATQPAITALQAEHAEYHADLPAGDIPRWSDYVDASLELAAWDEIGGPRRYITAQVGWQSDGCDGFGERAAVLFLRDGEALVPQPGPGFLDPLAVMDIDRDGQLEAVTDHGHTLESRAAASPFTRHYAFPDLGCGC